MSKLFKYHPRIIAIAFCLFCSISTLGLSYYESTLYTFRLDRGFDNVTIHGYLSNYSTIIDFLILNPLVIFLLLKCRKAINAVYGSLNQENPISLFSRIGIAIICIVFGFSLMVFYYQGFLEGVHYDAIINPIDSDVAKITLTGWAVLIYTALFIALTLFLISEYYNYIRFLFSNEDLAQSYDPVNIDKIGGLGEIMKPIFSFSHAMFFALLIFAGFVLYDYFIFNISDSNRVFGFVIYLLIIFFCTFLPIIFIHNMMQKEKDNLLSKVHEDLKIAYNKLFDDNSENITFSLEKVKSFTESYNSFISLSKQFPVWPIPKLELSFSIFNIAVAIFPILVELKGFIIK